jgi:hypothetical protein
MKLIKYNVIQKSFNETVKNYMEKFNNNIFIVSFGNYKHFNLKKTKLK